MELSNEIAVIRHLSRNAVNNTLEIGFKLKKIRDNEVFRQKYSSFTEMLQKEDLGFKYSEGFISKLLRVVSDPKLVSHAKEIGINKTCELLYVPDRETRNQIVKKTVNENLTRPEIRQEVKSKTIKRLSNNINDNVIDEDNAELKVERQGNKLLIELKKLKNRFNYDLDNLKIGINKWSEISFNYPGNDKIQEIKEKIKKEL